MAKLKPVPAPAAAPAAAAAPAGVGKSKLIMIVGLVVLVVAAASGGTWFALRSQGHGSASAEPKPAEKKAPVFVTLEPFTVNLQLEAGEHFLQAGIVYQVEGDKVVDQMKMYMPIIRNRILFLLSSKKPSDLAGADGKQKLVSELVIAARESLPEGGSAEKGIHGAIFSSFVIQ